jgi:hypothetical protein
MFDEGFNESIELGVTLGESGCSGAKPTGAIANVTRNDLDAQGTIAVGS